MEEMNEVLSCEQKASRIAELLTADGRFSPGETEALRHFSLLLLEKNEVMNLTAITEAREFYIKHILDSLSLMPLLQELGGGKEGLRLMDVGSGAGFPGIPLKIMMPQLDMLLLDSLRKRCVFLDEVISELKLSGIRTLHSRAEDGARQKSLRGRFDFVTARAVAPLPVLLELCIPYLKTGSYFLAMKGDEDELASSAKALRLLGAEYIRTEHLELPENRGARKIHVFRKNKTTPSRFPRKAGTPKKQPL